MGPLSLVHAFARAGVPALRLHHHIDQPASWNLAARGVIVRGWCFAEDGPSVRAIRLRVAGLTFSGVVGLPRPDVKAALPQVADENTGFEIRGPLPSGRSTVEIEAGLADGSWHSLRSQSAVIKRRIVPAWLGGGGTAELVAFQLAAHASHPPRPVKPERFPAWPASESRPKISIVTPSYQQARFLQETMESVLSQSGVAGEYVVQDGGSTDGSRELIERAARERTAGPPAEDAAGIAGKISHPILTAWESRPDGGQAEAIVRGFARTSGAPDDLMAWINSDDFYLPGALAHVAAYFERHPKVDVVYGHRIVVDDESREIGRWFLPRHDEEVLRLNDFVPQETLFWRRRIWDQAGGLDASFKFAMDWDLLLRFQAAGAEIVRAPYFLACFRVHAAQKTSAAMHSVGQNEIDRLRTRANHRVIAPAELERHPRLRRYLRGSAFIEQCWRLGLRCP